METENKRLCLQVQGRREGKCITQGVVQCSGTYIFIVYSEPAHQGLPSKFSSYVQVQGAGTQNPSQMPVYREYVVLVLI